MARSVQLLLLFGWSGCVSAVTQRMDVLLPKENIHAFLKREKTFAGREFRKNIFKKCDVGSRHAVPNSPALVVAGLRSSRTRQPFPVCAGKPALRLSVQSALTEEAARITALAVLVRIVRREQQSLRPHNI
jgi:hypothetical protein